MSPRPRNPRYFPTMKVRGARRRRLAPVQLLAGAFDRVGEVCEITRIAMETLKNFRPRLMLGAEHASFVHQIESQPVSALPAPITHPERSERPQST